MKKLILILIILFLPIKFFGQLKYDYKQGYKFIKKAEKNLNQGNLIKAEEFLKKAKLSNYGFCGNAWASAEGQINLIQTQVYNKRKEFDKALNLLDSIGGCGLGANCEERDSLKVVTLILKFGKEKVKESFKNVTKLEKTEKDYDIFYSAYLKELEYKFVFNNVEYFIIGVDGKKIESEKTENEFLNKIKNHNYYLLIE